MKSHFIITTSQPKPFLSYLGDITATLMMLGSQDSTVTLPFQRMARLEVSGIRQGNRSQINARVKQKTKQTRASDAQGLPAYIIVVEFSRPMSIVRAKHNPAGALLQ
ncbi:MAG: hypothetical protein KME17_27560 [Cyanosarcina radialis HA8281-LM2]|nr:hypothetical protein [Cyanosarcina radialis HA8281-LM2]